MSGPEFETGPEFGDDPYAGIGLPPLPPLDDLRIGPDSHSGTAYDTVREPQVRQPQAPPRASEHTGRAAVKGAAQPSEAWTDSTKQHYVVPSVNDIVSGMPHKKIAEQRDAFEGTIEDKTGQAFDKPLSKEQQVLLVGNNASDMDRAAKEVLLTRMEEWHKKIAKVEKMGKESRKAEVLAAHFGEGSVSSIEESNPQWYHVRNVSGVEGFLNSLAPKQLAEATARAATDDDPSAFRATHDVMKTVIKALQTEQRDPATGELVEVRPPLGQQLREGLVFFRDGRFNPKNRSQYPEATWKLDQAQITKIKNAKNAPVMNRNGTARDAAATFLEVAFDPDDMSVARRNHESASMGPQVLDSRDAGNRVRITNVGANGDGSQAEALSKLLAHALPFAIGANSPLGLPDAVYLSGVENAPPDALKRILKKCQAQDIPVVMTATDMTEDMAKVLSGSAVGVSHISPETARIVSEMLGQARREFTEAVSFNWGGNLGEASDKNLSQTKDMTNPVFPVSKSKASSNNKSSGESASLTLSKRIDPNGARATPAELGLIQPGQIAVFGSSGELHGLHSRTGRGWQSPFPPPDQKPEIVQFIEGRIEAIRAEVMRRTVERPALEGSAVNMGMRSLEAPKDGAAERQTPTFELPSPTGSVRGGFSMPVQYAGPPRGSDTWEAQTARVNHRATHGHAGLQDLKERYRINAHQPFNKDTADFGRFCVLKYVMGMREGTIRDVPLMEWAENNLVRPYVERHLRVKGYDVNDPDFWHWWIGDREKCREYLESYKPTWH